MWSSINVTFNSEGILRTQPLVAIRFPLQVSLDGPTPSSTTTAAPALRLLRSPSASDDAVRTVVDFYVVSSSRVVELHVQAQSESVVSYAQTVRGVPYAAGAAADDSASPSCLTVGPGAPLAFLARLPTSQAFPDWRVLELRFSSARATGAAGPVCTVYDIRPLPVAAVSAGAGTAAVAAAGASASATMYDVTNSTAAAAPAVEPERAAEVSAVGVVSEQLEQGGPAALPTAIRAGSEAVALAMTHTAASSPLSCRVLASGAAATAAAAEGGGGLGPAGRAAAPAMGSQMQQLRELLQRAAASVPPLAPPVQPRADDPAPAASAPPARAGAGAAALQPADGSSSTSRFTTYGSAVIPSAARANLGLAATLARSILQSQAQAQTQGSASPVVETHPTGLPSQAQQQQQQEPPSQAAAALPLPVPLGFVGWMSGALATATAQLAEVCGRVRRIEEHLLLGPIGHSDSRGEPIPDASGGLKPSSDPGHWSGEPLTMPPMLLPPPPPPTQRQQQQQQACATQPWLQQPRRDVSEHPQHGGQQLPPTATTRIHGLLPAPLAEQLLAVLPALAGGMARVEAAVAAQGAQLATLSRQMAEVQQRLDTWEAPGPSGAAALVAGPGATEMSAHGAANGAAAALAADVAGAISPGLIESP